MQVLQFKDIDPFYCLNIQLYISKLACKQFVYYLLKLIKIKWYSFVNASLEISWTDLTFLNLCYLNKVLVERKISNVVWKIRKKTESIFFLRDLYVITSVRSASVKYVALKLFHVPKCIRRII